MIFTFPTQTTLRFRDFMISPWKLNSTAFSQKSQANLYLVGPTLWSFGSFPKNNHLSNTMFHIFPCWD